MSNIGCRVSTVQFLRLDGNNIGDVGIQTLATTITPGPDGKKVLHKLTVIAIILLRA